MASVHGTRDGFLDFVGLIGATGKTGFTGFTGLTGGAFMLHTPPHYTHVHPAHALDAFTRVVMYVPVA